MARRYSISNASVPQSEALPDQVQNNAGGYAYQISPLQQLERFLILGSEAGTYYVESRKLGKANVKNLLQLLLDDPVPAIKLILDVIASGRAPKQDPAIFALAVSGAISQQLVAEHGIASSLKDADFLLIRQSALEAVSTHLKTGTQLFMFINYISEMRGWGSSLKRNVQDWYLDKELDELVYQTLKYQNREGYTHRDVLRLSHPKAQPTDSSRNMLFKFITQEKAGNLDRELLLDVKNNPDLARLYAAYHTLRADATDVQAVCELIREHNLPREAINTSLLNSKEIWEALLEKMPMGALIRNLGKLSSVGVLKLLSDHETAIIKKLTDPVAVAKSKIHPVSIFLASRQYNKGQGDKGSLSWTISKRVVETLEETFYMSFKNVQPTGKKFLLGIDVSGSMGYTSIRNGVMMAREGAALMAMVTARSEPVTYMHGFTDQFVDLKISAKDSFETVVKKLDNHRFGNTDCAQPMVFAMKEKLDVDVFAIYTDNETWVGRIHPTEALKKYNKESGKQAKLVVCGMTATEFSIADPKNPLMMDVVGFDTNTPAAISEFAKI